MRLLRRTLAIVLITISLMAAIAAMAPKASAGEVCVGLRRPLSAVKACMPTNW